MILPVELWLPIKNYEMYQVSNFGRIRRNFKNSISYIKPSEMKGYLRVCLCKNSKPKWFMVHRLVAEAFLPNIENLPFINHKDENTHNNVASNLEWCTRLYNNNYGNRIAKTSKPIQAYNDGIIINFKSVNDAIRKGYSDCCFYRCLANNKLTYKGMHWRYTNA